MKFLVVVTPPSIYQLTNIFDVKKKTVKLRIGAAKSTRRAIKVGNSLCTN